MAGSELTPRAASPGATPDVTPGATPDVRAHLRRGTVIPAHPLALTASRTLDERRQRALTTYYIESGAGGVAVGVHTTQFAIRRADVGLYQPVLELALDAAGARRTDAAHPFAMIAGVCGETRQAVAEAAVASVLGYDAALLSLGALGTATEDQLLEHCRAVADVIPLFGFYLQPAVGGRVLSHAFWREFALIPGVWAIKIAPFNRYQTIDVVRAVVEAERDDIALYTGNDDAIVADLVTPIPVNVGGRTVTRWMDGGLLGQWAVWTPGAVRLLEACRQARQAGIVPTSLLSLGAALTDANAAIFDAANGFAGCIAGIHEVLRREGRLDGTWCLDPGEGLSPGQAEEIDRVIRVHPALR
jgi:dihydrodipicolinate synthase/N-acetylneuraminate lyase